MKLTKLERHTAYILFYEKAKSPTWYRKGLGMCHLIESFCGLHNDGFDSAFWNPYDKIISNYFPELQDKQPSYGWPPRDKEGWKWRRKILQQCIEETY